MFALAGAALVDDYGVSVDEWAQRKVAIRNLNIIRQGGALPFPRDEAFNWETVTRVYGATVELPLLLVERALRLDDTRQIHLSRHILLHFFFIIGGFFCYLLVYRLFNNRLLALLALLLFLLHPRLYAHSFFNSKDLPFVSMFMIALFLIHRAFRKDTVGAFVLCGVAVGLLTTARIMGLILLVAVIAMRGWDLLFAAGVAERRRVLLTAGLFLLAGGLAYYVATPYLWRDPSSIARILTALFQFPAIIGQVFQGELILSTEAPPRYLPVWIAITTPPVVLLLALVGAAAVLAHGISRPLAVFRNGNLRFGFLLLAGGTLPVLAIALTGTTIYNGWRQIFFLYAPLCLLAAIGIHWLAANFNRKTLRTGVYGLGGVGLVLVVLQMLQLHPSQQVYFNLLVDRTTPEYLRSQYDLDYWGLSYRGSLECLLKEYPDLPLYLEGLGRNDLKRNREILPLADRQRIFIRGENVGFELPGYYAGGWQRELPPTAKCVVQAYGNTLMAVEPTKPSRPYADLAAEYRQATQAVYQSLSTDQPDARADFDLYLREQTLYYLKERCRPADTETKFSLHIIPSNQSDLPPERRQYRFDNRDFYFYRNGARSDGVCLATVSLPDYPIDEISTGQGDRWRVRLPLGLAERRQATWREMTLGEPATRSVFDLYLQDDRLYYLKEPCAPADTVGRFFLHFVPVNVADLPPERQQHGTDNHDFDFAQRGELFDGKCLARAILPDYPVHEIRTGQFVIGGERFWEAYLPVSR